MLCKTYALQEHYMLFLNQHFLPQVIETVDDIVYATQYPQDCHYGQNATSVNATGASLVLTASETCGMFLSIITAIIPN